MNEERTEERTRDAATGGALPDTINVHGTVATAYQARRLGTLDSVHLTTAEPFRMDLTAFVTYDDELAGAATDLGLPVHVPA